MDAKTRWRPSPDLLTRITGADGTPRYRMLESLRSFGLEQLMLRHALVGSVREALIAAGDPDASRWDPDVIDLREAVDVRGGRGRRGDTGG